MILVSIGGRFPCSALHRFFAGRDDLNLRPQENSSHFGYVNVAIRGGSMQPVYGQFIDLRN